MDEELRKDIASLAGQAPVTVKAKVSRIVTQGMPVGVKVFRGNECGIFSG